MQDTPMKNFQAKIGDFLLRLNLMSEQASDISHFNEGLSIYAANYVQKYCLEQFYNLDNIPKQALTIFFDLQTFFDYIVQNHTNQNKVKISNHGIVVSNIIKARGVQRRQEVVLQMSKKPLQESPIKVKEKDYEGFYQKIKEQNQHLHMRIQELQEKFREIQERNQNLQQKIKKMQENLIKENQSSHTYILQQQKNTHILSQNQQTFKQHMNNTKVQLRYLIDVINQLKREISQQKQQKSDLKQQIRQLRGLVKQVKKPLNKQLGQKIQITIDKTNPFLNKYLIKDDSIQKIDGDQTRFQILGNQILSKGYRTFFQVRIINLLSNGLIIGVVSDTRKGQRHSFDQKDCICYDGTGKIFQMGKKWPVPVKFQSGQLVRVLVDLEQSVIRWYLSYTEIGSALIPDSLRNCKLVPYLELNQVKDKISINK